MNKNNNKKQEIKTTENLKNEIQKLTQELKDQYIKSANNKKTIKKTEQTLKEKKLEISIIKLDTEKLNTKLNNIYIELKTKSNKNKQEKYNNILLLLNQSNNKQQKQITSLKKIIKHKHQIQKQQEPIIKSIFTLSKKKRQLEIELDNINLQTLENETTAQIKTIQTNTIKHKLNN